MSYDPEQYRKEQHEKAVSSLEQLIEAIGETGADLLVGSFNGGNDEGGIDDISLYRRREDYIGTDPKEMEEIQYDTQGSYWSDPIYGLANEIMSDEKYGGWAWEGSAWGMFYVDTRLRKAWEEGTETTEVPIVEPLVVQL